MSRLIAVIITEKTQRTHIPLRCHQKKIFIGALFEAVDKNTIISIYAAAATARASGARHSYLFHLQSYLSVTVSQLPWCVVFDESFLQQNMSKDFPSWVLLPAETFFFTEGNACAQNIHAWAWNANAESLRKKRAINTIFNSIIILSLIIHSSLLYAKDRRTYTLHDDVLLIFCSPFMLGNKRKQNKVGIQCRYTYQ